MMLILGELEIDLVVSRLPAGSRVPNPPDHGFFSLTVTPEEISIISEADSVPADAQHCEFGWRCFVVQGPLAFDQVGVLASLASPLAEAEIPILAISTFDTDYLLVKAENLEAAHSALATAGHIITRARP